MIKIYNMDIFQLSTVIDDINPSKNLRQFCNNWDDHHDPVDDVFCILLILPNIPPEHGHLSLT